MELVSGLVRDCVDEREAFSLITGNADNILNLEL